MSAQRDDAPAEHPSGMTLAEWQQAVEASVSEALEWLPEDALERLRRKCLTASARRRRRLERRDAAVRDLAARYTATSGRELAHAIEHDLALYRAAGRHRGPAPTDPRRALLHQVVKLSGSRALGWRQVFRILTGAACVEISDARDTPPDG